MPATLLMRSRRRFGVSHKARLNRELLDAVSASASACETCRDILENVDANAEGADFVEAPSFPGITVEKFDVHFRFHWKDAYSLLDELPA